MTTLLVLLTLTCQAQDSADLEKGSELRKSYVYNQKILARLLRTNSKLAREELRQYTVTPDGKST
jgi:hypothetical protein